MATTLTDIARERTSVDQRFATELDDQLETMRSDLTEKCALPAWRLDNLDARVKSIDVKVDRLEETMNGRFAEMDQRFNRKFDGIAQRFDDMQQSFEAHFAAIAAQQKTFETRFARIDGRFDELRELLVAALGKKEG